MSAPCCLSQVSIADYQYCQDAAAILPVPASIIIAIPVFNDSFQLKFANNFTILVSICLWSFDSTKFLFRAVYILLKSFHDPEQTWISFIVFLYWDLPAGRYRFWPCLKYFNDPLTHHSAEFLIKYSVIIQIQEVFLHFLKFRLLSKISIVKFQAGAHFLSLNFVDPLKFQIMFQLYLSFYLLLLLNNSILTPIIIITAIKTENLLNL